MTSTPSRNTRIGSGLALAALCALALTACGTTEAGKAAPARSGAAAAQVGNPTASPSAPAPSATPTAPRTDPADDPRLTPAQQTAELRMMQLALTVAEPCAGGPATGPSALPEPPLGESGEPARDPGAPLPPPAGGPSEVPVPIDDPAPETGPSWDFERARREAELGDVDKCAAGRHGERIGKALDGRTPADPAAVEKALHGLGYDVAYRLDGPRKKGDAVVFTLDLRFMGELCLAGTFDGTRTAFEPYGASPEVACTDVRRRA
ncbi:hypothetical protein [Streptomyces sp. NPDC051180]|uniref:hypothetical protein n=1 Tax=unclassified Streptomyces TaxID=2593676 RepID=UPI003450EDF3